MITACCIHRRNQLFQDCTLITYQLILGPDLPVTSLINNVRATYQLTDHEPVTPCYSIQLVSLHSVLLFSFYTFYLSLHIISLKEKVHPSELNEMYCNSFREQENCTYSRAREVRNI